MRFKTSQKIYIHVDCDCFFASCEVLRNPELKGKKVCVGGEIIIACTYEAKAL
jgi:DNA polymerase IV